MSIIKNILWDFDGVILDSMKVRDWGFQEIFKGFSNDKVDLLLSFHRNNGGLSRYVKIRYFFEEILQQSISEETVIIYASKFSNLMRKELINTENLIKESLNFIVNNHRLYNFHIVSGSDQEELRFLCKSLEIEHYFLSIHGSPTSKNDLVKNLLQNNTYEKKETCLIGDSINDFDAAKKNKISFIAFNNSSLNSLSDLKPFF